MEQTILDTIAGTRAVTHAHRAEATEYDPPSYAFKFSDIEIPAVYIDEDIWLSATPVCRALGLRIDRQHRAGSHTAKLPEAQRDRRYMPTEGGLQDCAVVTLAGAAELAKQRRNPIGSEFLTFLREEAAKLPIPGLGPCHRTLSFSKQNVRVAVERGTVWFATDDVYRMIGRPVDPARLGSFEAGHVVTLSIPEGPEEATSFVSLLGVFTILSRRQQYIERIAEGWARKQAKQLLTLEGGALARIPITLLADGTMPPSPGGNSDEHPEWIALRAKHKLTVLRQLHNQQRAALQASSCNTPPESN